MPTSPLTDPRTQVGRAAFEASLDRALSDNRISEPTDVGSQAPWDAMALTVDGLKGPNELIGGDPAAFRRKKTRSLGHVATFAPTFADMPVAGDGDVEPITTSASTHNPAA